MKKPLSANNSKVETKVLSLKECLAKTVKLADGRIVKGTEILPHCMTVGLVAKELVSRQPKWLQEVLFPKGCELIAAAHDLGKVSPHFQEKLYAATGEKELKIGNAEMDKSLGGHATISQVCLTNVPKFIPEILGRHHGFSPSNIGLPEDEIYGGLEWQHLRMVLLENLKKGLNTDWPIVRDEIQANVLSGLTCVADWIGSVSNFDRVNIDGIEKNEDSKNKIADAVDQAGFVGFQVQPDLSFESIFMFQPREAQVKLYQSVLGPGVYILEAPMGMGKTEAALFAAYQVLEKGLATGIYFALPTQLTSEKIYDRMNNFLDKILGKNCKFRSLLLHSSAWLRDTDLGEEGMPGRDWFNKSKRGLLAPFAVGTIDQALMGVINVKHGFVRAFGLAGKVVILDEVHSYDSYTGTILTALVKALREMHCTVIILSATLTASKRAELIGVPSSSMAYPLVSALPKGGILETIIVETSESATVSIEIKHQDEVAIEEALLRAERGEQVLWIENVVADAQALFKTLAGRARAGSLKIELGLLHSRFQRKDRTYNEDKWVGIFGKDGHSQRIKCGRILIGTQVLEQSLDIDADFLITRICPTDMLFQRIGRLWRHRSTDVLRPVNAKRESWILSPTLEEAIHEDKWKKTGKVYSLYVLYRTLEEWVQKQTINLPNDIRSTLEATYLERDEKDVLGKWKFDIETTRKKLMGLANVGLSTGGKTMPESKASTRYSETESCEVLLIKEKRFENDATIIVFLDCEIARLAKNIKREGMVNWKFFATKIQENIVIVPEYLAPKTNVNQIQWLREFAYLGDDGDSHVRVAIVKEDGNLRSVENGEALPKYHLAYSAEMGFLSKVIKS